MSLTDEERNTIVKYELEKARKTLCEESDYNCIYDVTPDELTEKIEPAKRLIHAIAAMID